MFPAVPTQRGFTLIEMLVSLALFTVVITMSIGSLLVLISANTSARNTQVVMSNVSFALDSMTRDIRTGYNYYCGSGRTEEDVRQDCANGGSRFSFVEGGQSLTAGQTNRVIRYYLDNQRIFREFADGEAQQLTADQVTVDELTFTVTGAAGQYFADGDTEQPTVTIFLSGEITDPNKPENDASFDLQTTITQRRYDI